MSVKRVLSVSAVLFIAAFNIVFAQEQNSRKPNIYTVFYNSVRDDFNVPLIGFVNIARGNHSSVQLGFTNMTHENFVGLQAGFVNTSGGLVYGVQNAFVNQSVYLMGLQNGFVNLSAGGVTGVQNSFINSSGGKTDGVQNGFINLSAEELRGVQNSFVNVVGKDTKGVQNGFVNITKGKHSGTQFGFMNTVEDNFKGVQIGFVNVAPKALRGAQIGFINIVDTIESGIPLGFLSIVKRGGYKAVELGFSNHFPFQLSFKTGIEKFYTSIIIAGNPNDKDKTKDHFGGGFGIGSIVPINDRIYINPEATWMYSAGGLNKDCGWGHVMTLSPMFGINFTEHLGIAFGPSADWLQGNDLNFLKNPVFDAADYEFDGKNIIQLGAKAALRFKF